MIHREISQFGGHNRNNLSDFKPTRFKRAAKMICAIAVMSIGIPLHGHNLQSGSKYSIKPAAGKGLVKNTRPIARSDFVDLRKAASAFNVLVNDTDPDGDRLILIEANAKFGAVAFTPDGLLAYAQDLGTSRSDIITYVVSDGHGGLDKTVVKVSAR